MIKAKDIKNQFIEILTCGICKEIMNEPLTITCNHTFCYMCIAKTDENMFNMTRECPLCKKKYCLPPQTITNYVLRDVIKKVITEKKYDNIKKLQEKNRIKLSLRNQAINELRNENYDSIIANADYSECFEVQSKTNLDSNITKSDKNLLVKSNEWKLSYVFILGTLFGAIASKTAITFSKKN